LRIEGLSKGFGGQKLFENITCEIRGGGERVALLGPNGCGKTTLLKILTGETAPDAGTVAFGPSVRWAYLPQIVFFDHPERTLYDTMLYETDCTPQEARDRLGSFRFIGDEQFKTVSQLSGGEKTRLRLCMLMMRKVNLLILDEPTNHLDLSSREWVEEAVSHFEGTLLFVSHDRYFIKRFASRVWDLDGGFRDYDADYERYRRIKALEAAKEKEAKPDKQPPSQAEKPPAEKPRRDPKTERRLAALERDIARREAELTAFDDRMAECGSDYEALLRLGEEKEQLEKEIEAMYGEWERMSEGM
ncbi:MAG: ABC-F family ATP-binding cassette domain-containing protein, partial [Clostridia bacterium]|nr:ABC-F family ATP-binding cassette domain-containing protein [Clostridia bacterium]